MKLVYIFFSIATIFTVSLHSQPIARPDIIYFDSGKTNFNLLINDSNAYKIIEYSTSNSKGTWTRYIGSAITIRKVSYFGSLKLRTDGIGYFEPNKNTPDTLLIHYTISDWKSGTSQTTVTLIRKSKIQPYTGQWRIGNFNDGMTIYLNCDSITDGKQMALLTRRDTISRTHLYGYISDTSEIELKYRFLMSGDIVYSTYPYSEYPFETLKMTWTAHLTREQWYYIKYEACK